MKRLEEGMKKYAEKEDNKYKETLNNIKHYEYQLGCEIKF